VVHVVRDAGASCDRRCRVVVWADAFLASQGADHPTFHQSTVDTGDRDFVDKSEEIDAT
jgi:hypothetical protein